MVNLGTRGKTDTIVLVCGNRGGFDVEARGTKIEEHQWVLPFLRSRSSHVISGCAELGYKIFSSRK
jgi:hypothetical protein